MKMNRVQFQPGLSMPEFYERYATEAQCRAALEAARWPTGFACPACGGAVRTRFERGGLRYWQCGACAHQCSLISGTIFEASKLPLTRWFLAMQLLTQTKNNDSALELMRQLGVSYCSAWLMQHKVMEAMRLREDRRGRSGRVEIDDAYLGGELSGGKNGRGSQMAGVKNDHRARRPLRRHDAALLATRTRHELRDERAVNSPKRVAGGGDVVLGTYHTTFVAAGNEHQWPVESVHIVEKDGHVHCTLGGHQVIVAPSAVILVPLSDVTFKSHLAVDLELVHIERLA